MLYAEFGEEYIEMLIDNPCYYLLFELEPLNILNKFEYEVFNKLISTVQYPELIRFKSIFLSKY